MLRQIYLLKILLLQVGKFLSLLSLLNIVASCESDCQNLCIPLFQLLQKEKEFLLIR